MFSPEFRLLLLSCRTEDSEQVAVEAIDFIGKNKINWEDLYTRADFHGIRPQLGDLLEKLPSSLVTDDIS